MPNWIEELRRLGQPRRAVADAKKDDEISKRTGEDNLRRENKIRLPLVIKESKQDFTFFVNSLLPILKLIQKEALNGEGSIRISGSLANAGDIYFPVKDGENPSLEFTVVRNAVNSYYQNTGGLGLPNGQILIGSVDWDFYGDFKSGFARRLNLALRRKFEKAESEVVIWGGDKDVGVFWCNDDTAVKVDRNDPTCLDVVKEASLNILEDNNLGLYSWFREDPTY